MNRPSKTIRLCACSFLLMYGLFHWLFYLGYVPSSSMEPTIHQNSYILGWRPIGSLHRGDVIIFRHEDQTLIKRISYMSGDLLPDGTVVPNDSYYVLGDNRSVSLDSRFWREPFVPRSAIIAKYMI